MATKLRRSIGIMGLLMVLHGWMIVIDGAFKWIGLESVSKAIGSVWSYTFTPPIWIIQQLGASDDVVFWTLFAVGNALSGFLFIILGGWITRWGLKGWAEIPPPLPEPEPAPISDGQWIADSRKQKL